MKDKHLHSIHEKLQTLQQWDTVPSFCHAFYSLITKRLSSIGEPAQNIGRCYLEFLNAEIRYHQQLSVLAGQSEVPIDDVQSLAQKRQVSLQVVAEDLASTSTQSTQARGVKHLILAECYYHRRDSERVVKQLRVALSCGVDDPLIRFALGYNLYVRAIERYTIVDADDTSAAVLDHCAFQAESMRAVAEFEKGLSGEPFDVHVYAWMAHVLESAGMVDAAADIQRMAVVGKDDPMETGLDIEPVNPKNKIDNTGLPPITEAEIQQAGELLEGTFTPAEVRGEDSSSN